MTNWDFVIDLNDYEEIERTALLNPFKTDEANTALHHAYEWACAKASTSANANAAKLYIEAIGANRKYDVNSLRNPDHADWVQLNYIIANLTHWRGAVARVSKQALNDYSDSLSGPSLGTRGEV